MLRFTLLPILVLAFLSLLGLLSPLRGGPGDRLAVIVSHELGPVDITYDEKLDRLWATSFEARNLRPYNPGLQLAGRDPIALPFKNPLLSWATGIAYNPLSDTFFVADTFANKIHEVERDGDATPRCVEVPQLDPDQTTTPYGLAFDPSGDAGRGTVYVALGTIPRVYELTLEGDLVRSFPPQEQLDVRFGENESVRLSDVDLIYEDGNLVGFYVAVSLRGNQYQILRLDAAGNLTDKWLPLDEASNPCDGILRVLFMHPDTGEQVEAFICVQSMGSRFVVIEAGEFLYHRLFDFQCVETDRNVTLTWKGFADYDSIEIFNGREVLATLPGNARTWETVLVEDGVYVLGVRAYLGEVQTVAGACVVVRGPGELLDSAVIEVDGPGDLASDGDLHIVSDSAERQLRLFNADFSEAGTVPISPAFAAEDDRITGVAFGDEADTAFVYNVTQHRIGKIHFTGDVLFSIDARLPNIELDPLKPPRKGRAQHMIFDPLAATGSLWVLEETRDFLYELSLAGVVLRTIPHPYLALDPLPAEAEPGVASAGLSWVAGSDSKEMYLLGAALRNHGEPVLFRFDLDAMAVVPGSAIPTHKMGRIVAVQHVIKEGKSRLIVLNRSRETRLLEVDATPYIVAAPSFFTSRQRTFADDVELTFTTGGPYDLAEVFRDGEKIAELEGVARAGTVSTYVDRAVEPGIHEYAVRGMQGGVLSVFTRSSLRVGVGAILARTLSYPVMRPRALGVDAADGTFYVADAFPPNERQVFHFDANFSHLETRDIRKPSPWQIMGMTTSVHSAGATLLPFILSEGDSGGNFVLVTETTGGAQDSEIKIFPPELPGFFIRPGGLAWDPSSNTLYYMERQSNMIVQMDMAGNTLRVFPRPVLLPNSFIGSEGLAVFWEPGAGLPPTLFITGVSSPAADRVNTIFEFDVNGQLTGHEIPLPSGSYLGITFVGHDLVALKSSTPGEFITLKAFSEEPGSPALFIRGDANGDVTVNLSDAIHLVAHLFQAGPPSPCEDAADANDDGKLNLSDAIYTIGYLFQGGQEPPPPFQRRGTDPTEDLLSCR